MSDPIIDLDRIQPLLEALERARRDIEALDVAPALERALQRVTEARGAHMSTRIEGNPMTEEEVRAEFARTTPGTSRAELENRDYRDAARLARQFANDVDADIDGGLIRALHYLVSRNTDRLDTAGQYRTEANVVRKSGAVIYQPPPPIEVPRLMADLVVWLREHRRDTHPAILAAVAHAELVNVHPFDDGNGRTARALTKYFLERGGWHLRGFVSSEQVFGEDIEAYYAALRAFGPRYPGPQVDLTEWVAWFLRGLVAEASAAIGVARTLFAGIREDLRADLSPRLADGLTHLWIAGTMARGEYARVQGVSLPTASGDLKQLETYGYARRVGLGRSTRYETTLPPFEEALAEVRRIARGRAEGRL